MTDKLSKRHRAIAAKVTLKFTLKTTLPQKQTTCKANIQENAVIAKNIITDTKAKRQK